MVSSSTVGTAASARAAASRDGDGVGVGRKAFEEGEAVNVEEVTAAGWDATGHHSVGSPWETPR